MRAAIWKTIAITLIEFIMFSLPRTQHELRLQRFLSQGYQKHYVYIAYHTQDTEYITFTMVRATYQSSVIKKHVFRGVGFQKQLCVSMWFLAPICKSLARIHEIRGGYLGSVACAMQRGHGVNQNLNFGIGFIDKFSAHTYVRLFWWLF